MPFPKTISYKIARNNNLGGGIIEKLLRRLFDYQRFEKDKRLDKIIREVEDRYSFSDCYISDLNLSLVAGGKNQDNIVNEQNKKELEE